MSAAPEALPTLSSSDHVLITGGAGFIGSHLANLLVEMGCKVRVLDILSDQVHDSGGKRPAYLDEDVELQVGDVRDFNAVKRALKGITHVCHLAAAVGVGQSMYKIARYTDINNLGTAVLLECLAAHPVQRLMVASSMSIYGEGLYESEGRQHEPSLRTRAQLQRGEWELCEEGRLLKPRPTPESKRPHVASVYALSKYDQEQLCLMCGSAYQIPTIALRFFNVFGPHQSLSNPYTGALAIFASRCLNNAPPHIFEDGLQQRDFVSVHDVAQACVRALCSKISGEVFNIGSGHSRTILDVARSMISALDMNLEPLVTGKYRVGDIRHCYADISKARQLLGYNPTCSFSAGLTEFAQWLSGNRAIDRYVDATQELEQRGLTL